MSLTQQIRWNPVALFVIVIAAAVLPNAVAMDNKAGEYRASEIPQELKLDTGNVVLYDKSLKPGDVAPDFTLPNEEGELVSLGALLKKGPVVVVFYRGVW